MIFFGKIENSKLVLNEPDNYKIFLSKIKDYPSVIVNIEKRKKTRTLDQNSYYWGYVLDLISSETGHSNNELHSIFKKMFLSKRFIKLGGKEREAEPTTTILDVGEFIDYIDKIKVFSSQELGITFLDNEDYMCLKEK